MTLYLKIKQRKRCIMNMQKYANHRLSIFKSKNGKDYDFFAESKEYIFYLL